MGQPRHHDNRRTSQQKRASKRLEAVPTSGRIQYLTGYRIRRQTTDATEQENEAGSEADLWQGRDLSNESSDKRHVGTGREAEDDGEDDQGRVAGGGDPHGQREDAGRATCNDEDVEFAELVCCDAG